MTEDRFRKAFLLLLVITVSVAFIVMIESFLTTILTAAIFAGLAHPLYARLVPAFRGNRALASGATLVLVLALVIAPLLAILGVVGTQAIRVTGSITPVVTRFVQEPSYLGEQLRRIPGFERIEPYREVILTKAGDLVNSAGGFLIGSLSDTTRGTVAFVFQFFIVLYTMFFLLMDGPGMLRTILNYLPLNDDDKAQVIDRFLSVTRATVKGTLIIGVVQGALTGLAFWVVGIPYAMFWSVLIAILSILPLVGGALVWVPACLILVATGAVWKGLLLALFCSLIVGSVDNLLRPRLVGRDTKMHDLVILFSTLGGIMAFGPIGFIIGPILAGLFITTWDIFGVAYRDAIGPGSPEIVAADDPPPAADELSPAEPGVQAG